MFNKHFIRESVRLGFTESKLAVWPTRRAGVLDLLEVTAEDCDAARVAGVYLVLVEGARRHRRD